MKTKDIKKLFKSRYESYQLPSEDSIKAFTQNSLPAPAVQPPGFEKRRSFSTKKLLAVAAAVILSLCIICSAAYAAVPYFRALVNIYILYPENEAVEIYTYEQLNLVRNDLSANYKLMCDIVIPDSAYEKGGIFEGGFSPIGGDTDGGTNYFFGIFDGNGHTVYGLRVKGTGDVGLFSGVSGAMSVNTDCRGVIMNLRLCDGTVTAVGYCDSVGAICGKGNYVVGCSVENFEVITEGEAAAVGGIGGYINIADSCYSDATLRTSAICKGTVAGYAKAVVTCYSPKSDPLCGDYSVIPALISGDRFEKAKELLTKKDQRDARIIFSFFQQRTTSQLTNNEKTALVRYYNEYNCTEFSSLEGDYYVFEPSVTAREDQRLRDLLKKHLSETEISELMFDHGTKQGPILNSQETNLDILPEGFDNGRWVLSDGTPKLSCFD